jgi:ubiquinone/menaquinone biosynthesis C-methylase UbiE
MRVAENLQYWLAKRMSSGEVAHSEEMKSALETPEEYAKYRLSLVKEVTNAAERFDVDIIGKDVLDLGCYDGAVTWGYIDYGAKSVVGVDIDAEAVAEAKKTETTDSDQVRFHQSTIDGIPLPDQSVETTLCYDVFEHVEDPPAMLAEMYRVTRPGGTVLIGTWGWKHPFAPHLWSTMPVPYAHVFFSEKTILRVCKRVYESDWYVPTFHDMDENGNKKEGKYDYEEIPKDYLNKYLVKDFEKVFAQSDFNVRMHPQPFGSRFASWTKVFLGVPWVREFIIGYLWIVLERPATEHAGAQETASHEEAA